MKQELVVDAFGDICLEFSETTATGRGKRLDFTKTQLKCYQCGFSLIKNAYSKEFIHSKAFFLDLNTLDGFPWLLTPK